MIKYETINGTLCRMVEPEPLNEYSKTPCIMRNKYRTLKKEYILSECQPNPTMSILADSFEIIGYPVADGSAEWALWQMQNGKAVCHTKAPSIKYSVPTHYVKRRVRENCTDDMSIEVWLSGADEFGWQLYEEPEPAFKVGDWVEHKESKEQGRITYMSSANYDAIEVKLYDTYDLETYTVSDFNAEFRKLSPSEVRVKITLEGMVMPGANESMFELSNRAGGWNTLGFNAIDSETAELVKALLKAQEEK